MKVSQTRKGGVEMVKIQFHSEQKLEKKEIPFDELGNFLKSLTVKEAESGFKLPGEPNLQVDRLIQELVCNRVFRLYYTDMYPSGRMPESNFWVREGFVQGLYI